MATLASAADGTDPTQSPVDVEVLVVGAGVTGIYQLYLAREAGFSVLMLEAGTGVGGTWYCNRYPGSRYDSESYTYGYFFSKELFHDWTWPEVFTGQAENERYFNHVVDRFDLRRHIRFNTRIVAEDWDEQAGSWIVRAEDGLEVRARFVVNATGVLSIPYIRLRYRCAAAHGDPGPGRAVAQRLLGGGADDVPGGDGARFPEHVLPGRAARRRREQPPLQR